MANRSTDTDDGRPLRLLLDSMPLDLTTAFLDTQNAGATRPYSIMHVNFPAKAIPSELASLASVTSSRLLSRGVGAAGTPWVLTRDDMARLREFQGLFFEELSRHDLRYRNFAVHEMGVHYFELVNFWVHTLRRQAIDACFAGQLPRLPSTTALYFAAKLLNVPYVYLELRQILNRFRMFGCSLTHRAAMVSSWHTTAPEFVHGFHEYVANIRAADEAETPTYIRNPKRKRQPLVARAVRIIRKVPGKLKARAAETPPAGLMPSATASPSEARPDGPSIDLRKYRHIVKNSRRRWDHPKASFNFWTTRWYRIEATLAQASRRRRYRRRCVPIDSIGTFVYYAAHLQPESATLPATLEARYQYLAVRRLVDRLPDDVTLAYKENPKTFNDPGLGRVYWKSKWFHDEVRALGRVALIDDREDTLGLITRSMGVASILGTATAEAIVRGRHAITFAPTWHDHLDGVHLVDTESDIDAAYALMQEGPSPKPDPTTARFDRNFLPIDLDLSTDQGRTATVKAFFGALDDWHRLPPDVQTSV